MVDLTWGQITNQILNLMSDLRFGLTSLLLADNSPSLNCEGNFYSIKKTDKDGNLMRSFGQIINFCQPSILREA